MAQTTRLASFGPVLDVSTLPVTFHTPTRPFFVLLQACVADVVSWVVGGDDMVGDVVGVVGVVAYFVEHNLYILVSNKKQ